MKNEINHANLKRQLKDYRTTMVQLFSDGAIVANIAISLGSFIDNLLHTAWRECQLEQCTELCLIALGSYGRQELQLYSDIDVMILYQQPLNDTSAALLEQFIRCLWDIGLDIGSQITTIADCVELASNDISVMSSLMDQRYLGGSQPLYQELCYFIKPSQIWPSNKFFQAKWKEQLLRHKKYGDTGYNLEPNVKNSPGGMRDLQMILWVAQRHYGGSTLGELFLQGFVTEHEYHTLIYCRNFLWQVRFGLHYIAGKREDRLLFDYQKKIALLLGYQDDTQQTALDKFMKHYFTVIKILRQYNDMLLQSLREAVLHHAHVSITDINQHYRIYNRYLEVKQQHIFKQHPEKLLEIFLQFATHPKIHGVRAGTIRLMHHHRHLIGQHFRNHPEHHQIFLEILQHPRSVYRVLQRMNRYGLLGQYIPAFGKVVGQMQYDLFHAYTVDQHTLFLIRNIVKFYKTDSATSFALCHTIVQQLPRPHILFVAALFHDIAKGRGGDHSELGANDVTIFCQLYQLPIADIQLIAWLVKNHLLMSHTAQRKDIYDPQTIADFCQLVPQAHYIEYLYVLTIADICATNPKLWNSWKDTLLKELYIAGRQFFKEQQQKIDEQAIINNRQQQALSILHNSDLVTNDAILALWQNFKATYFLYEPATIIAQHTQAILLHDNQQLPLIISMQHYSQGGTEFFIYMPYHPQRFAIATTIFSNFKLNILEARISSCNNSYTLDTYIVLDSQHKPLYDKPLLRQVRQTLTRYLSSGNDNFPHLISSRISRQQQYFNIVPAIEFFNDQHRNRSGMFLVAADRPGLLARIGRAFVECKVLLHNAKIATAGARVEDVFYITNDSGNILLPEQQRQLSAAIMRYLQHP